MSDQPTGPRPAPLRRAKRLDDDASPAKQPSGTLPVPIVTAANPTDRPAPPPPSAEALREPPSAPPLRRFARRAPPWAVSLAFHAGLLIALGLWVLPRFIPGGVPTLSASLDAAGRDALQHALLDASELPLTAEASSFRVSGASLAHAVVPEMQIDQEAAQSVDATQAAVDFNPLATLSGVDLGRAVKGRFRRPVEATGAEGLLHEADGIEGAVDGVTSGIRGELTDGDVLVVWLLDASISLLDDRQRVAERLEPFYQEIAQRSAGEEHRLMSAVVSFGAGYEELVPPTEARRAGRVVAAVRDLALDPTGLENVFTAVEEVVRKYRKKTRGALMVVVWTDESGDDIARLEQTIAACRQAGAVVSVVGPTAVFGREEGAHLYRHPDVGEVYLPVKKGPDTPLPERLRLPYWYATALRINEDDPPQRISHLPPWMRDGGIQLETLASGFGPYALTRLARETGGTFTILDRPGDRGPFRLEALRPYVPEYGPLEEYVTTAQEKPLRRAVLAAVRHTFEHENLGQPPMLFFGSYRQPGAFRNDLKRTLPDIDREVARIAAVVETALAEFGPTGMEREFVAEYSPRWRAWHDLTRGRLLAMNVRLTEYRQVCDLLLTRGFLDDETNNVVLAPYPQLRGSESIVAQAREAERLLKRCVEEHPGTPWAYLAERELDHALGIFIEQIALPMPPPPSIELAPVPIAGGRGGGGGGKPVTMPNL